MVQDKPKVQKIYIEFDDHTCLSAEGDDANKIWEWWRGCEVMNSIHGANYTGPNLKKAVAVWPD